MVDHVEQGGDPLIVEDDDLRLGMAATVPGAVGTRREALVDFRRRSTQSSSPPQLDLPVPRGPNRK